MGTLTTEEIGRAFRALDALLPRDLTLIIGGGTAMLLAHGLTVATTDVDGYPAGMTVEELDPLVKRVAKAEGLAPDWLNAYYQTFAHVLPADYRRRLKEVFRGGRLNAQALGVEDLLVMKCFAGRAKDRPHARALLRRKPDLEVVEARLAELQEKRVPGAAKALDFLDDLLEELS